MPFSNFHDAVVNDKSKFDEKTFRTKEITPGIQIVIGKMKSGGDSMVTHAYHFDQSKFTPEEARKWMKDHNEKMMEFAPAKPDKTQSICPQKDIIMSSIPVFKNKDLIIPFVRDGTKAYANGREYTITSEALDKDFKSYENGHITINHKQLDTGKISEVWREKPFVYGRITGLSDELKEMILSKAYKGVSQESTALSITESGDVTSLQGLGTTIVFFPEVPACSQAQGCGTLPIASTLTNDQINSITESGDTNKMAEYTSDEMETMLKYMESHLDMLNAKMQSMMKGMVGSMMEKATKSTINVPISKLNFDPKTKQFTVYPK